MGEAKVAESRKKRNDGQLLIRIPVEDRDRFMAVCEDLDTSAAREIRRFIRDFVEKHEKTAEGSK